MSHFSVVDTLQLIHIFDVITYSIPTSQKESFKENPMAIHENIEKQSVLIRIEFMPLKLANVVVVNTIDCFANTHSFHHKVQGSLHSFVY